MGTFPKGDAQLTYLFNADDFIDDGDVDHIGPPHLELIEKGLPGEMYDALLERYRNQRQDHPADVHIYVPNQAELSPTINDLPLWRVPVSVSHYAVDMTSR